MAPWGDGLGTSSCHRDDERRGKAEMKIEVEAEVEAEDEDGVEVITVVL